MKERVLLVGATSGIGRALARALAVAGHDLVLAGRDVAEVERLARDVSVRRGVEARVVPFEARDFDSHEAFFEKCATQFAEGLDGVAMCQGDMPPQAELERDFSLVHRMIDVNYTATVSVLNRAANYLEARESGWLCAVTSVAGDRGRRSNFLYGSTKAGTSAYLEGLHARLAAVGVGCLDVRPGPVDTALTYGSDRLPLLVPPERVAGDIVRAIRRRRRVLYSPGVWRWIMVVLRAIPSPIFRRLPL